ncbi:winged helix-turn-helix domain-containing protein [Chloroflexota bacterium]
MTDDQNNIPPLKALQEVESILRDNFEIEDWQGLRILFSVAVAHYIPGEPLWLRVIGASRSGRTEILRALLGDEDSVEMESLTPASIRGGFKGGERLLDRIDGKRVITKDLAPLITARKETRLEIFGLLRSVKDGSISSDFGTFEGHIYQNIKFDWILAVTPVIESIRQIESLLGERYIDLHWIPGDRKEMAFKAATNNENLADIREQLSTSVYALMEAARQQAPKQKIKLPDKGRRLLAGYADSVALCRSPVLKDSKGNILVVPKPEIGTSLAQDFCRVTLGLKLLGIKELVPYIARLSWDCIPSMRAIILRALKDEPKSVQQLQEVTGLSKSTIYYHLRDLQILGVVKDRRSKTKAKASHLTYNLSEDGDDNITKQVVIKLPPIPKKVR